MKRDLLSIIIFSVSVSICLFTGTVSANNLNILQGYNDSIPILVTGVVTDTDGETLPGVNITVVGDTRGVSTDTEGERSEEHTSELQSRGQLVCRLRLEKK